MADLFRKDAPRMPQAERNLRPDGLPVSGTTWKDEGIAVTLPNPGPTVTVVTGQDEEGNNIEVEREVTFKIPNPDPHGRIPQRISSAVRGQAEIVSANGKEVTLRSLSGSEITTLSVIMEY